MASIINALSSGTGGIVTAGDASGILQLQTANTAAVTIDGSQRVGIGTTNPNYLLDVALATSTSGTVARFNSPSYEGVYISAGNNSLNCGIGTQSTTQFNIYTNSTQRVQFDNSGNINLKTSNAGIIFNNSSALTNSTLNDYESGTWTPTYLSSGGGQTVTYGQTVNVNGEYGGTYTKIGNMVFATFTYFVTGVSGGSGYFQLGGLPFTQSSAGVAYGCGSFGTINNISHSGSRTQFGVRIEGADNKMVVWEFGLASGSVSDTRVPWSAVPNSQSNITGWIFYRANF